MCKRRLDWLHLRLLLWLFSRLHNYWVLHVPLFVCWGHCLDVPQVVVSLGMGTWPGIADVVECALRPVLPVLFFLVDSLKLLLAVLLTQQSLAILCCSIGFVEVLQLLAFHAVLDDRTDQRICNSSLDVLRFEVALEFFVDGHGRLGSA